MIRRISTLPPVPRPLARVVSEVLVSSLDVQSKGGRPSAPRLVVAQSRLGVVEPMSCSVCLEVLTFRLLYEQPLRYRSLITSYTNGYDGSMINGLQIVPVSLVEPLFQRLLMDLHSL